MHNILKFLALLKYEIYESLNYRASIFIWMMHGIVPFISMFAWTNISFENELPLKSWEIESYFLAVFTISQLNASSTELRLQSEIISGAISNRLLKPVHPFLSFFALKLSYTIVGFPIIFFPFIFVIFDNKISWNFTFINLIITTIFTISSMMQHFFRQVLFGLISMWTDKSRTISQFWHGLFQAFSGILIPYSFFPDEIREFLLWTPFPSLIWLPAHSLSYGFSLSEACFLGSIQLFWTVSFGLLAIFLWKAGTKRLGVYGI